MKTQFLALTFMSAAFFLVLTGLKYEPNIGTFSSSVPEVDQPVRTIVVNSNDQMKFDTAEIRVKAGETIKLTLNHTGKLPVNAMGHNFVLLAKGTDLVKFSQAAMKAKGNDYIPANGVLAHTDLIGGGETTTVTFKAPAKGTYDFVCSFPGHYAMMKGKFIVE